MTALPDLGLAIPVVAAPLAGGPTTPELVVAAATAGSLGFLAGGYKTAAALRDQIATVRASTATFGVNLFAPNPVPVDPVAYARYRAELSADAERLGVELPDEPLEDDDQWRDKVDALLADPVPLVSFTFGIPDGAVLSALRRAGSVLVQTVTSADEARRAATAGVDVLAVQASAAGGHSATTTPSTVPPAVPLGDLIAAVAAAVDLPLIAAGGLVDAAGVAAALDSPAQAVMVGTALLLAPEAGTSAVHRRALTDPRRPATVVTHAFTGRPARAIPNAFLAAHDATAPTGYPAVHHLTSAMRRASAAAGDPDFVHLWAGTGYPSVRARPAADTLLALAADL